jgi:hypothetical protein
MPNICNFNEGYTAPSADAVDFVVSLASPTTANTSSLGQKWTTKAVKKQTSSLGSKWTVEVFNKNFSALGQKWSLSGVKKTQSTLQQNWAVFTRQKTSSTFGQKWIVTVPTKTSSLLQNFYSVFTRQKTSSVVGQKWSVSVPTKTFSSLNQKWVIDPVASKGLVSYLNGKWIVNSGPFTSWSLPYAILVSTQWDLLYKAIIARQWDLPSLGTIAKAWDISYSLTTDLNKQFDVKWDLDTGNDVVQAWKLNYSAGKVEKQWDIGYSLTTDLVKQWSVGYDLTFPVVKQWALDWDINTFDTVKKDFPLIYAWIGPEIINISGQPTITLNGNVIEIFQADISTDEEGFIWQADITILNIDDYKLININDEFTLDFYGENFTLIAESKTLDRFSPVGLTMFIRAVSPAIKHDFPRAEPCTISYTTPVMAKATAEALLGESITWNILDWEIPANRLGISDGAPIQLVKQIVEAVGGVLESNPDGTLVARPKYPVSMNILEGPNSLSIDQTYFDTADNLSISEEYTPQKLFNKFRISDTSKEFSDDLDFDFNEIINDDGTTTVSDTEGKLKAFVTPFRENIVIKSSQDSSIGFELNGVSTEQLTELIEIREGVGSVSKPILTLDSWNYQAVDLGTPTFVVDDRQIITPNPDLKYGLIEVTYTTRFVEYDVTGVHGKNVQFRLEIPEVV